MTTPNEKRCPSCSKLAGKDVIKPKAEFGKTISRADGLTTNCRDCENARKSNARALEKQRRLDSKHVALGVENYNSFEGEPDEQILTPTQEVEEQMGQVAEILKQKAVNDPVADKRLGSLLSGLAEDEQRFMNRRHAKSVSIALARDELSLQRFKAAAEKLLTGKIDASGYATKTWKKDQPRVLNVLLSDLHIGAGMGSDNPEQFKAEHESRRLAKIVAEVCDWKPQYRSDTKLNVYLNGDLIDGLLLHDLRDGEPLTEQFTAFWRYMAKALAYWSMAFPTVHVEFQPGNHGRNRLRHPGRATSSKWDGEETKLAIGLAMMSSNLKNVSFHGCGLTHKLSFSTVHLPGGHLLGLTHGDTEIKLGDPDSKAKDNIHALGDVNATMQYGNKYDVFAIGHFHKGRIQYPRGFNVIWNAALVPPNGHARTAGYGKERCGQFIWESVAGYPVGDVRFIEVGASEDKDASLNHIIPAFVYEG